MKFKLFKLSLVLGLGLLSSSTWAQVTVQAPNALGNAGAWNSSTQIIVCQQSGGCDLTGSKPLQLGTGAQLSAFVNSALPPINLAVGGSGGVTGLLPASNLATGVAASNLGFTPLNPANNLSDLASVTTARTNLGLGSLALLSTPLPYADLPALSANQLLGALIATTPSGLSVPSCSGSTNALTWASGVGFGCNTIAGGGSGTVTNIATSAPLSGGPITTTGTIALTGPSDLTTFVAGTVPMGAGTSPFVASEITDVASGGVTIGSPTGGQKGAGTINMTGCFINNVPCAAGSSTAFSSITGGTNASAAMVVGTGASLGVSGSGTIAATSMPTTGLTGQVTLAQLPTLSANTVLGALTGTTPSGLAVPSCVNSAGNHLNYTTGTGFSCGTTSSSGSPAFNAITSGTNSTAAMVIGTGASLTTTGSGILQATSVPVSGLTGLGTGVATALTVAPGTTGSFSTQDGAIVTGNCLKWGPGVQDAGNACGSGGSVSITAATPNVVVTPSPITGTGTIGLTQPTTDQSGAGTAIVTGYNTDWVYVGNFTYTLAQAGTTGFTSGWGTCLLNTGSSGNATINATTSIFKGAGNTTTLTLAPGAWACPTSDGANYATLASVGSGGGSGTVTSVGLTVPASSILGVTGSPVTTSGNLGLTTTGASGGVPYFSSTSALSSSTALSANALVKGGGAGAAPSSSSVIDNGTLVNATAEPLSVSQAYSVPSALTDGATIAVNAALSNNFTVTIAGNRTLSNPTNLVAGQILNFQVTQDATGNRTLAFGTNYNGAISLNPAANAVTMFSCYASSSSSLQCAGGAPAGVTASNCSSGASPAVCGSARAGSVAVPTGATPTLVINSTAVTATSEILLNVDESATIAGTTCNTTLATLVNPVVTARSAGTSFTIQMNSTLAANPACVDYQIVN